MLSSLHKSQVSSDHVDVEIICDMLFILAAVCEFDLHRKAFWVLCQSLCYFCQIKVYAIWCAFGRNCLA